MVIILNYLFKSQIDGLGHAFFIWHIKKYTPSLFLEKKSTSSYDEQINRGCHS